jgi:hypothetical protein
VDIEMNKYTWSDGFYLITNLSMEEAVKRYNRLDTLRVLTEGYEDGQGYSIYTKALRALNSVNNFTGVIRLNFNEKDFLGYILDENPYLNNEDRKVLEFYIHR